MISEDITTGGSSVFGRTSASEAFRNRLLGALDDSGLTVEEFAQKCAVPKHHLQKWLSGEKLPSMFALYNMSVCLGVTTDWLISGNRLPDMDMLKGVFYAGMNTENTDKEAAWQGFCKKHGFRA